ncbi:C4-dicarboxylate transporter DctM subunit [Rhodobium orientis]|uniref:TRAP transporter large permease protein n=1 Tax=Rhodobium orientis TaxID=34017 RepID=A0A327JDV2_9HYPH|nr:TRAP transporter large permease [Rhodobium orientis]MBB4305680.1 C4-dicarboxylate transporter DctM subunit [Rhodobium orientis]MBK5948426.1 C4-dicarboxylate ABC transporter permease [Rhodobium orientis]RAI24600.1 C4-dicarboxylate ABC transporter permease [Rhodobium orientis]
MTLVLVIVVLLLLLFIGLPVAFALAGLGTVMLALKGLPFVMVAQNLHGAVDNFVLLSVPLFLLMSNILLKGGVGRDLFDALQSWVGHWPGGLGIAALASCGIFSAISGSSVATAATVATVAVPEMTSRGYGKSFTLGLLAAGGTLGILIPPSIPLIVYGVITEESIGKLFLAGIGPGILLVLLFGIYCVAYSYFSKEYQPSAKVGREQRWRATMRAIPTGGLAALMIGGIYSGIFTPTEASAVGAVSALLITALVLRSLTWQGFVGALRQTVSTTIVLFLIVIGAKIFGKAVTIYQVPAQISMLFDTHAQSEIGFLLIVGTILLFIGLFLESLSMLLIMMPVLFPTVLALGIDPIWFAMYFVVLIEVALITPPVGLNLFVIQAVARCSLATVARGVLPFIGLMFLALVLLWLIPAIVTYIPYRL